jgi:hypothetical protein
MRLTFLNLSPERVSLSKNDMELRHTWKWSIHFLFKRLFFTAAMPLDEI